MAKKGHKKKKKVHHRRRMGAVNMSSVKPVVYGIVGTLAGLVSGRLLNNKLATMTLPVGGTVIGAGETAVGTIVAVKAKNIFLKGLGVGLAANGAWYALGNNGLKVLPAAIGYPPPNVERMNSMRIAGYRDVPRIGFPKPNTIGNPVDRDRAMRARMYAGVYGG